MTDAERRKRTEEELFLLFAMLTRDTAHNLIQIVTDYYAGRVSLWQLSDALIAALRDAHSHAAYLGRRLAGNRAPFGRGDQDFAASVVIGQARYLEGLVLALQTGRYPPRDDGGLPADLVRRLGMYASSLRGTALEAWTLNLPAGTLVNWTLHPAEHCEDCVARAAGSPYDAHAIPWHPGDGTSACVVKCKCTLEIVDGGTGFPAIDLDD